MKPGGSLRKNGYVVDSFLDDEGPLDAAEFFEKTPPIKKKTRKNSPAPPRKLTQRSQQKSKKLNEIKGDTTEWTLVRSKNKTPGDVASVSRSSDRCSEGEKENIKKIESRGTIQNVFDSYGFIESKQMDTNVFFAAAHVRSMLDKNKVPALATMFKVGDAVCFSAKPQAEKSGCRWIAEWLVKQNKPSSVTLQVLDPKLNQKITPPLSTDISVTNLENVESNVNPVNVLDDSVCSIPSSVNYHNYNADPEEIVKALLEAARQGNESGYCMFSPENSLGVGETIYKIILKNFGGCHPLDLLINAD